MTNAVSGLDVDIVKHGSDGAHISVEGQNNKSGSGVMTNYFFNVFAGCCGGDKTTTSTTGAPEAKESINRRLRFGK